MERPCIVVVEDDQRFRELIGHIFKGRGYRIVTAGTGREALETVEREDPNLVLLDVGLPDLDGFEVCRRIRERSRVPTVMLTARAQEAQKVRGLALGADDYITKPFGADELLARIEAILQRSAPAGRAMARHFRRGELTIDFAERRATLRGAPVRLTTGEYRVLEYLARCADRVVTPDELLRQVWGPSYAGDVELVYSMVRRLRQKLAGWGAGGCIGTRRGLGYQLAGAPVGNGTRHQTARPLAS